MKSLNHVLHKIHNSISTTFGAPLQPAPRPPKPQLVRQLRPRLDDIIFCSQLQSLHSPCPNLVIRQPSVDLFCFRDCWVVGPQGYIFLNRRTPLGQGGVDPQKMMRPLPKLSSREDAPLFYLAENSVSRAHAVMQHLSRYEIAREFLPRNTQVIVQKGQSEWHTPYLQATGAKINCRETSFGTIQSSELYFVPLADEPITNLIGDPNHYLSLRHNALLGMHLKKKPVFISRGDAPRRRLVNENRIFEISRRLLPDLERICLEGYSFKEQLAAVAGAPVLIAPHGQGSHLALFTEKTTSIQLVPGLPTLENPFFECALLFDFFATLGGESITLSCASGEQRLQQNDDWYYPESKFEHEINLALRSRPHDCVINFK